jgi:hypothetical protein
MESAVPCPEQMWPERSTGGVRHQASVYLTSAGETKRRPACAAPEILTLAGLRSTLGGVRCADALACGSGSVVEHLLAKEKVASSNLVFRSGKALTGAFFRAWVRLLALWRHCGNGGMADAAVLKTAGLRPVRVRIPLSALVLCFPYADGILGGCDQGMVTKWSHYPLRSFARRSDASRCMSVVTWL